MHGDREIQPYLLPKREAEVLVNGTTEGHRKPQKPNCQSLHDPQSSGNAGLKEGKQVYIPQLLRAFDMLMYIVTVSADV